MSKYFEVREDGFVTIKKIREQLSPLGKEIFDCLQHENQQLKEQLQSEIKNNFKLKDELEKSKREYQETYKDVQEEIKNYKKELQQLKEENKKLKQWDCNKDTRNSRQRVANARHIKQRDLYKSVIDEVREFKNNHIMLIYTKKEPREMVGMIKLQEILDKAKLGDKDV